MEQKNNQNNTQEKLLYSVSEFAKLLGIGETLASAIVNSGLIPYLKLGGRKIRRKSVEKFLDEYDGYDLTNLSNIHPIRNEQKGA